MKFEPGMAKRMRTAKPVRRDFATLVAVAVARQSSSATAQVIAATEAGPVSAVSLVELFGARSRKAQVSAASFNSGVAALLTSGKET
jgi:hypothetical protein